MKKVKASLLWLYMYPFVQAGFLTQSYRRYSYAFNNPLAFTDPSGYANVGAGSNYVEGYSNTTNNYWDWVYGRGDYLGKSSGLLDGFSYAGGIKRVISGDSCTVSGENGTVTYQTFNLRNEQCGYYVPHIYAKGSYEIMTLTFPAVYDSKTNQFVQNNYQICALLPVIGDLGKMDFVQLDVGNEWTEKAERELKFPGVSVSIDEGRDQGYFNPFTNTMHIPKMINPKDLHDYAMHEYGHYLQLQLFRQIAGDSRGFSLFLMVIVLPSMLNAQTSDHMSEWYEINANDLSKTSIKEDFYDTNTYKTTH